MKYETVLFDFDDTLVETYPLFLTGYEKCIKSMKDFDFREKEENILRYLKQADIASVSKIGYPSLESFPMAIREMYRHFCEAENRAPLIEEEASLVQFGWDVHHEDVHPVKDAEALLQSLCCKVRLLLVSQGERQNQMRRIKQCGLFPYFDQCIIVPLKTADFYIRLAVEQNICPETSCMIGNSMRNDINPALEAGYHCIYVDLDDWDYDYVAPVGKFQTVHNLKEVMRILE